MSILTHYDTYCQFICKFISSGIGVVLVGLKPNALGLL